MNFADPAPSPSARSAKPARKTVPQTPTSLAAAQQSLKDSKPKKAEKEEEPYVYLPPGSSMREPGYNSMSDPVGGRVSAAGIGLGPGAGGLRCRRRAVCSWGVALSLS